jgi:hypothetical protein
MKQNYKWLFFIFFPAFVAMVFTACKKDYYVDGGLADAHYDGSIYDYLASKPYLFDSVVQIIDLAGLKEVLTSDTVTFFCPTDESIGEAMEALNKYRYSIVEDSVHMEDISPEVWKKFLSMYILEGKYTAATFPRVDPDNIFSFPGINYVMLNGYVLNIGLIYNDYGGAEAVGARILNLTDITYNPNDYKEDPRIQVMTSDIQPNNGVLHVLKNKHVLGFRGGEFTRVAEQYLLMEGK